MSQEKNLINCIACKAHVEYVAGERCPHCGAPLGARVAPSAARSGRSNLLAGALGLSLMWSACAKEETSANDPSAVSPVTNTTAEPEAPVELPPKPEVVEAAPSEIYGAPPVDESNDVPRVDSDELDPEFLNKKPPAASIYGAPPAFGPSKGPPRDDVPPPPKKRKGE